MTESVNLKEMALVELEELNSRLRQQIDELRGLKKHVADEMESRTEAAAAISTAQAIIAGGIPSEEQMGNF